MQLWHSVLLVPLLELLPPLITEPVDRSSLPELVEDDDAPPESLFAPFPPDSPPNPSLIPRSLSIVELPPPLSKLIWPTK